MGQVLHGSARTIEVVRRAIQHSEESLSALARRHGVNPKMIAKWKTRTSCADLPTSPQDPRSTSLSIEEEAVVVALRRHTLLPLDDCLYALPRAAPGEAAQHQPARTAQQGGEAACRRRRAYALCATLPNEDSITRLIGAVLLEQNDEYQLQNRYMQIEGMAALATPQIEEVPPLKITPKAA